MLPGLDRFVWILLAVLFEHFSCRFRETAGARGLRRGERGRSEQISDPQQRVDSYREGRQELHFGLAVELHLAQRPTVLAPAKALLDAFADSLTGHVAGVACGPSIDCRAAIDW